MGSVNAANMKDHILKVLDILEPVGDKIPAEVVESISSGRFFEDYEGKYDDKSLLEYSKNKILEMMKNNKYVDEVTEVFACKKNFSFINPEVEFDTGERVHYPRTVIHVNGVGLGARMTAKGLSGEESTKEVLAVVDPIWKGKLDYSAGVYGYDDVTLVIKDAEKNKSLVNKGVDALKKNYPKSSPEVARDYFDDDESKSIAVYHVPPNKTLDESLDTLKNFSKIGDKLIGIAEEFEKAGLPSNFVDEVLSGKAFEELDPKSFDKEDLIDWLDKYLDKKNWKNKESIVNKFKNNKNNFAATDSDVAILIDRLADILGTTSDKLDIVSDIISAPKVFKSGAMSLIIRNTDDGKRYFISQYLPAVSSLNYKKYDTAIHITSEDGMNEYYAFKDGKSVNYSIKSKNFSPPDYRPYVVNDYGSSKFNKFLAEVNVVAISEDKVTYFEVKNPGQNKNLIDTAKKYDVKVIYPGDFSIKDESCKSNNFSRKTITDEELKSKYEEYSKTHKDNEGLADYLTDEFNLKNDEVDELVDRLTEILIPDNFSSPVRFSSYKLKNPRINY